MRSSHAVNQDASDFRGARERLSSFLERRRRDNRPVDDFEQFERELHAMFAAAECEALGEELARFDVDAPVVEVEGLAHRKVLRCEQNYTTAAGPVRVTRSLYSTREVQERALCPLELRADIVEGQWTPLAARQMSWVVAHLTPQEGEDLFKLLGDMTPSKSSLDRLPKRLSGKWEAEREQFEEELRERERVPEAAVAVAVSLDGVMVPMKDGKRQQKRAQAEEAGRRTRGPAGHQEAGCGTVSFYDGAGELLSTVRMGRMPESKKKTLKEMLTAEVTAALDERPDLELLKIADGARDNWTYLSGELPAGEELVDFYHVDEHLYGALCAAYGEGSAKCKAQFEKHRHVLRHEKRGAEKVIRSLVHLRRTRPRSKKIKTELSYFRRNRKRMRYAEMAAKNLPIGTGVTEAACKTLATERMKRSGMRWRHEGGQAILTLRSLIQSDRFDHAWEKLSQHYKKEIRLPENVIAINAHKRF